jgi:digeranylgeranylglycerophospholipid reductase
MRPVSDAIGVGAGPVGSFAALNLAKRGVETAVFEEHAEIGVPSHCAGHLSICSLTNLGLYPLPNGIVENTFSAATFYSPNGAKFAVRLSKSVTCIVNRVLFDRFLAEKAEAAGARFSLSTRVQSLAIRDEGVMGVNVERKDGGKSQVTAKIVVDAEGISSRLSRQAGLTPLKSDKLVYAVETEMENVKNLDEDSVEVFLGNDYAPGFYAWIIPRRNGTAKIGLATKKGNPKAFLERLMLKHPVASKQLSKAHITQMAFHPITLGGPVSKAYANGLEVIHDALKKNDLSAEALSMYQKQFVDALGFDFSVMRRARRFLDLLSDDKLDDALRFCNSIGLNNALRDVDEIDFQGRTLLTALTKPAAFAALLYFLKLYLTTNP